MGFKKKVKKFLKMRQTSSSNDKDTPIKLNQFKLLNFEILLSQKRTVLNNVIAAKEIYVWRVVSRNIFNE